MTLALPAYSRYAQEARPYALMVLAVTLCVLAWWRWCERGGRAAATWYVVSVAVLPLCHTLALSLVAGQVIAALLGATARGPGREPGGGPGALAAPSWRSVRRVSPRWDWSRSCPTCGWSGVRRWGWPVRCR